MSDEIIDNAVGTATDNSENTREQDITEDSELGIEDNIEKKAEETTAEEQSEESKKPEITEEGKKIQRQTAALAAANRKIQELKKLSSTVNNDDNVKASNLVKPTEDDYDSIDDYANAMIEYGKQVANEDNRKIIEEQKVSNNAKRFENDMAIKEANYIKQTDEFRLNNADYDDVTGIVGDIFESYGDNHTSMVACRNAVLEMDNIPELLYHVGNNIDIMEKLAVLSPIKAVMEITRISDMVNSSTTKKQIKPHSKPPTPISGNGKTSTNVNNMSANELVKWMNS